MTKGRVLCIGLMGIGRLLAASTCEALANLSLPDTAIATAVSVPAGSYTAPDGTSFPNLPAFCRVAGSIQPAADSNIEFEVWLPNSQWNGKFAGADNGGFGGAINYAKIGDALSHNYAAASTDTGHTAGSLGVLDASWALGHPEKVTDYGYRAIHQTAQMGAGHPGCVLWATARPFVFQWLLEWWKAGADGGPALPGGLRRYHRRFARELHDASIRHRSLG
jgi:hypothetical protein